MRIVFSLFFLLLVGSTGLAAPISESVEVYRQIFASPAQIVSAAFSVHSSAARAAAPATRLAKYFEVTEKTVGKDDLYLEVKLRSSIVTSLLPSEGKVKIWVKGLRASPEGPWRLEAIGPVGPKMEAVGRLFKNSNGSMAEITIENSSSGAKLSKSLASGFLRSGLVFPTASAAQEASQK